LTRNRVASGAAAGGVQDTCNTPEEPFGATERPAGWAGNVRTFEVAEAGEQPAVLHAATATAYTVFAASPDITPGDATGDAARAPFTYTRYEETAAPPSLRGGKKATESDDEEAAEAVGADRAAGTEYEEEALDTGTRTENRRGAPSIVTFKRPLYVPRAVVSLSKTGMEAIPEESVTERGETSIEGGSPESCTTTLGTGSPSRSKTATARAVRPPWGTAPESDTVVGME